MTDTLEERAEDTSLSEVDKQAERDGILASLRVLHKFISWWEIEGFGLVVCRRFRRTETLTFANASQAADKKFEAGAGNASELMNICETAVKTTCVWPKDAHTSDFFKRLFDEYPDWSGDAAVAIQKLSKEGIQTEGKG